MTASAGQSVANGTPLQVAFNTAEFNVANGFNTTSHVFQPNAPGYYAISLGVGLTGNVNNLYVSIYKNGAEYRRSAPVSNQPNASINALVHCNGSTDTIMGYVSAGANATTSTSGALTFFSAALVQATAN